MDNTTPAPAPIQPPSATTEDKTVAIISYLTIIGFIVAIIMHSSKKTKLGAFHLRQVLGFIILGVVVYVGITVIAFIPVVRMLDLILYPVVGIAMLVFWIMGLIAAVNGERKPMPLVGPMFQTWLGTAFE